MSQKPYVNAAVHLQGAVRVTDRFKIVFAETLYVVKIGGNGETLVEHNNVKPPPGVICNRKTGSSLNA